MMKAFVQSFSLVILGLATNQNVNKWPRIGADAAAAALCLSALSFFFRNCNRETANKCIFGRTQNPIMQPRKHGAILKMHYVCIYCYRRQCSSFHCIYFQNYARIETHTFTNENYFQWHLSATKNTLVMIPAEREKKNKREMQNTYKQIT